ncbi:hypothetical protein JG687_00003109 [Phytophthora cactorum]|uniref:Uncharacterized protein n=1 Tax=Phytophthora cactorum TaxID=29920 RepID=A0A8T1UT36_9STRA|nr:hypothetical protein JG687_00003109 [Phytophthora cactorum]
MVQTTAIPCLLARAIMPKVLVGCSCYSCVETNGNIEASCTAPFECTPMISSPHNEETNDAPSIGDGDYGVVCAVFLATAIILGGSTVFVARFCFPDNTKEPSIKQTVTHRLSSVAWCLYTLVSFASFVQDDGASVTFIDYLCDKNELFGLIDWRKKTAAVRPRWMRAAPSCQSIHTVKYCYDCSCQTYCDRVDIGCTDDCQCRGNNGCGSYRCSGASSEVSTDSATDISSYACQSADVETSSKAYWVTMLLTMVLSKATSIAIGSAEDGSLRQKLLHLVGMLVGIALVAFGVIYSNHLSKEEMGDPEAVPVDNRQSVRRCLQAGGMIK